MKPASTFRVSLTDALMTLALLLGACSPQASERATVELNGYVAATEALLRAAGWRTQLERAEVPLHDLRIGPIARTAFVPITTPRQRVAAEVELDPSEPVLVHRSGSGTWAWPLSHLVRRELVLDELEGLPVAITYCSLCASARAFERRVEGEEVELAVSGLLLDGNALLYDIRSESLWRQLDGLAVVGELAGRRLRPLSTITVSFGTLRGAHPNALVMLAPEAGLDPPLERISATQIASGTPPAWLQTEGVDPFELLLSFDSDTRLPASGDLLQQVEGVVILRDRAAGLPGAPRATRPGSAAAFRSELDGRALRFEYTEEGLRDLETGSHWNLLGEAIAGPLAGRSLETLPQTMALRFALEAAR